MPIALLIDDNEDLEVLLAQHLEPRGFNLEQETDPDKACEAIHRHKPDIVLLDLHFPGDDERDAGQTTGVRLNAEIRGRYPDLAVLVFTNRPGLLDIPREHFAGIEPHAQRVKPDFRQETWPDELAGAMNTAIELAQPTNADLESERLGFVVGRTEQMRQPVRQITIYARQSDNVMIYGEQGAGKSLVAKAIHKSSNRAEEQFSEFHSRAKGEVNAKLNKLKETLRQIGDGTLYLSDIHLLESELQEYLIEEQIEARLIAGTHKSLHEMEDDGFHNDLADCLVANVINLPSLKERLDSDEDYLGELFRHFVEEASDQVDSSNLHSEVVEKIRGYDWPKNVREFKRVINQAVNTAVAEGSNVLLPQHFELPEPADVGGGDEENFSDAQYKRFVAREPFERYQFLRDIRNSEERADLLIKFICCELRAREGVAVSHQILFDAIHGYGDMAAMEEAERAHNRVRAFVNNSLAPRGVNLTDLGAEGCAGIDCGQRDREKR